MDAGGYLRAELWPSPIVFDGEVLSWDEAMSRFVDRTGRPGPSIWEGGSFSPGEEELPVGGVSWYEAAAYAAFAGKSLPTVQSWFWAATPGAVEAILPRSNFAGQGPWPVGQSGSMSGYGTLDMAGNVREWVLNEESGGKRYLLGGGWDGPSYAFALSFAEVPWDRSPANGFRLAHFATPGDVALTADPIPTLVQRDPAAEPSAPEGVYEAYRRTYLYDPLPLNAKVELADSASTEYIREYVTFDAAYGEERMGALLFIPIPEGGPRETVLYYPGLNALSFGSPASTSVGGPIPIYLFTLLARTGRIVALPILKGTFDRGAGTLSGIPVESAAYRDQVIQWVKDGRRTLDYPETRPDVDPGRFAFLGTSWGAGLGLILVAVEPRIRVASFNLIGLSRRRSLPEVDPLHHVPRIGVPTLLQGGRHDHIYPYEVSQRPLFERLGTPAGEKRHVVWETGHSVPAVPSARETLAWLDRYLTPLTPLRPAPAAESRR